MTDAKNEAPGLRNRQSRQDNSPLPPPVPPKPVRHDPQHQKTTEQSTKPLPPTPTDLKPLPPPPIGSVLKTISFWVTGFCLWFMLIVIMLPFITEKDAFPGLNRWFRMLLSNVLAPGQGKEKGA